MIAVSDHMETRLNRSIKQLFRVCLVVYCFKVFLLLSLLFDEQIREPLLAATGRPLLLCT